MAQAVDMLTLFDKEDTEMRVQIEGSIKSSEEAAKRRKLSKGIIKIFGMPDEADNDSIRRATVRLRVGLYKGALIVVHTAAPGWPHEHVCMIPFGKPCPECERLQKKHNVTYEELMSRFKELTRGEWKTGKDGVILSGVKSTLINVWPIWYGAAQDGAGEIELMAYPANDQSPVYKMHALNDLRYVQPVLVQILRQEQAKGEIDLEALAAQVGYPKDKLAAVLADMPEDSSEDDTPREMCDYDIVLAQTGKGLDRSFSVNDKSAKKFKFQAQEDAFMAENCGGLPWSKLLMKMSFALNLATRTKNTDLLQELQERRQALLGIEAPQKAEGDVKKDVKEEYVDLDSDQDDDDDDDDDAL